MGKQSKKKTAVFNVQVVCSFLLNRKHQEINSAYCACHTFNLSSLTVSYESYFMLARTTHSLFINGKLQKKI